MMEEVKAFIPQEQNERQTLNLDARLFGDPTRHDDHHL